ncbi:hypothetical protein EDP1_4116 [Pseudomonas putida S610]|nr:hypothetical protein EDP1_4116 [Pseudomonas putida S610]
MVVEDAFLQWRQWVDILDVAGAAWHLDDDARDGAVIERDQRQHCRSDLLAARGDQVGRHQDPARLAQGTGQRRDGRLAEQGTDIDLQAFAAQPRGEVDGQQRVPAQFEEVVVTPHLLDPEQVSPGLGQRGFYKALRWLMAFAGPVQHGRLGQRLAVELAVAGQGQHVQACKGLGHQVHGQAGQHGLAQRVHVDRRGFGEPGQQPVITYQHHSIANPWLGSQRAFDFAQFHTHAAHLDLVVVAAQVLQGAVRSPAHQVTTAVHASIALRAVRVGQEALVGQSLALEVAARHPCAPNVQLAYRAQRHQLAMGIEHVDTGIGDRRADVQRRARGQGPGGGNHRGFGRPVVIDHREAWITLELTQTVTADQQGLQGRVLMLTAQRLLGHRGRQEAHRQRLLQPPVNQLIHVFGADVRRRHVQNGPGAQGRPDLPGHGVEAEACNGAGVGAGAYAKGVAVPMHQVGQGGMFDHYPLRLPGGAGGVDHIGQLVRIEPGHAGVEVRFALPVVLVHDRAMHGAHSALGDMIDQHRFRGAVIEQVGDALIGVGWIDRHVGRPTLEHGQQANEPLRVARQAQGNAITQAYALLNQVMSQAVGAAIEFAIAQHASVLHQRSRLRRAGRLGFDQPMHGLPLREGFVSGVEAVQQLRLRLSVKHRQHGHRQARPGVCAWLTHLLKRDHQPGQYLIHGTGDLPSIDPRLGQHTQAKALAQVIDAQGQRIVAALFAPEQAHALHGRAMAAVGGAAVAVVEQGTEQRQRAGHSTAALGQCQGGVLVHQQRAQALVSSAHGLDQRHGQVDAQRQGIDEHTQRPVGPFAAVQAAHQDGAKDHVTAVGQCAQHPRPGQVRQAGDAHPQVTGLLTQPPGHAGIDTQVRLLDGVPFALHVGKAQRQGGFVHIAQHLAEERLVPRLVGPEQGLGHVVSIRCRRRQRVTLPGHQRLHLAGDDFHGGVVQGQVVELQNGHHAQVARIGRVHQAHHRGLRQVQALLAGIETRLQGLQHVGLVQSVDGADRHLRVAPYHLHRLRQAFADHGRTQNVVAVDHLLQRRCPALQMRQAVEGQARLQQVRVALLGTQVMEQNALLQRGQGIDFLHVGGPARHAGDDVVDAVLIERDQAEHLRRDAHGVRWHAVVRHLQVAVLAHGGCQGCQGGLGKQHTHVGAQAGFTHAFDQGHGQQRVPAQFEEVIVPTDALDLEHLGPEARQGHLDLPLRGLEATGHHRVEARRRQATAIQLAIGGERQCLELDVSGRQHVVGQLRLQPGVQVGDQGRGSLGRKVGHQPFVPRLVFAQQHNGFPYAFAFGQARLDFTQLDTETTQLDLLVGASQVAQGAVCLPGHQIAAAVQPILRPTAERIGDEALGRQRGLAQVTQGYTVPADVQLADGPHGQRLLVRVQHVAPGVADRPADGQAARLDTGHLEGGGKGGGFGRPVAVEHVRRCTVSQHPGHDVRVQHVTSDHQVAQACEGRQQGFGKLMEQAGG